MRERRMFVRIPGRKSVMPERRKFVRIPENSQISYKVLSKKKTESFLTKDICQGGIRFFVYEFVPIDSILEISLALKNKSFYFGARARVIWIKGDSLGERYEIGVEFIDIPKKISEFLIDYIKRVLKIL